MSTKAKTKKKEEKQLWEKQFTEDQLELWGKELAYDMIDYYFEMIKRKQDDTATNLACIQKIREYYEIPTSVG